MAEVIIKGLFLGAGASYECGFPLADELTHYLKLFLTQDRLGQYNLVWKNYGHGLSDKTLKIIDDILKSDMNYEDMIGYLEVLHKQACIDRVYYQELHHVIVFFTQTIHLILLDIQIKNTNYCLATLATFRGIKHLVVDSKPLWIFSLNHDLNIEMLITNLGIPLKTGFFESAPTLINSYKASHYINFEKLTRENIDQKKINFFNYNESGVNLLKLHGSLDIFANGDELNYFKVKTENHNPTSGIEKLKYISQINFDITHTDKIGIPNESLFFDKDNNLQFLRNSLLTGKHKFSDRLKQIAPPEFLTYFEYNINYIKELICIGYSFGDDHVNKVIKAWLSYEGRTLVIVNPYGAVPLFLSHLTFRVKILKLRATEYFMELSSEAGDAEVSLLKPLVEARSIIREESRNAFLKANVLNESGFYFK